MVRDWRAFEEFEAELESREPVNIEQNFRILDALYEEARLLGIFPLKDPLDAIDVDIEVARVVNLVRSPS